MIRINSRVFINEEEISFAATRSSGPGGQNVNKVATRVTLSFDLEGSAGLSQEQKQRISRRLAGRINKRGILQVSSQRHRTQTANRRDCLERFVEMLASALQETPPRLKTKIPKSIHARRLQDKARRSEVKRGRRPPKSWD